VTTNAFQHLSVDDLAVELAAGHQIVIVDIRDPNSFASGHIPNAVRLHDGNAQTFVDEANKSTRTVVCCYHGHSSQGAAAWLVEQGFSDVCSLDGGATEWSAKHQGP
jgi:thiosulfate sulfurtransferase